MKTETVDARHCTFSAEIEFREPKNETDKTRPIGGVARTGDIVEHAFWGRVVHDLDSMRHKNHIPLDYNHDSGEVVGFLNRFATDTGDLNVSGALTPSEHEQHQRTQEIIDKHGMGVPYEFSINFAGSFDVERIPEGETVFLNQRTFSGPLTVIRNWPLRGVAVTPYGKDADTQASFSESSAITYNVIETEDDMSKKEELSTAEAEVNEVLDTTEAVDAEKDTTETAPAVVDVAPAEDETPDKDTDQELSTQPTGKDFMTEFGRVQGAIYFAEGLTFDAAKDRELQRLRELVAKNQMERNEEELSEPLDTAGDTGEVQNAIWSEVPGINDISEKKGDATTHV